VAEKNKTEQGCKTYLSSRNSFQKLAARIRHARPRFCPSVQAFYRLEEIELQLRNAWCQACREARRHFIEKLLQLTTVIVK